MRTCRACEREVQATSRFCPECGAPLESTSDSPTRTAPHDAGGTPGQRRTREAERASSLGTAPRTPADSPTHYGRFGPGSVFGERYRIIGLLGYGGMGEVYRADDLKLSQPVALKFLPPAVVNHPGRLERFHGEVRTARQVSHPNVCRVYDIDEAEGLHFLSMEYVDGEDLASLLRRIGRLPKDKALDIARQLCAGLAAAHDKGVLHRDLKPANVMLDGRGKIRITDFGLAGLAAEFQGEEVRAGTPAYMAPEQLAGQAVSVQSDLYSLGLVLYEMFTGQATFAARSAAEISRLQVEATPTRPSKIVDEIEPAIERVILRCLEKDPRERPPSALAVAAALPGGDPLAAALAAGETPAPELVAASGEAGGLRPLVGVACLAAVVVGLAAMALLSAWTKLYRVVPLDKPPAVLVEKSREILARLGYREPPVDSAWGFAEDADYVRHVGKHDRSPRRWDRLGAARPAAIYFWYRQSPQHLIALNATGAVRLDDPPAVVSGMASVRLDPSGRLVSLRATPPQLDAASEPWDDPDWTQLFAVAGLDPGDFRPTRSTWNPPTYCDRRTAWEGTLADTPATPVRVEAGAYRGQPVWFEFIGPWTRPERMEPADSTSRDRLATTFSVILVIIVLIAGILVARHNLRLGRGDRRGALRLAGYIFVASLAFWFLQADHVPLAEEEFEFFIKALGPALFYAGSLWLLYIALEPYVRRRWPHRIISWTRLLAGRWRDPLVGRDVLLGVVFGVAMTLATQLDKVVPAWLGLPPPRPEPIALSTLGGVRYLFSRLLITQASAVFNGLFFLFFPLLLAALVRRQWLGVGLFFLLITGLFALRGEERAVAIVTGATAAAACIFVILWFGLLASTVQFFIYFLLIGSPLTLELSAWYVWSSVLAMAVTTAVAAYGLYTAQAGRPLLRGELLSF